MESNCVTLHGDLSITICRARSLPNKDAFSHNFRRCFSPCLAPTSTTVLRDTSEDDDIDRHYRHSVGITSDPYVAIVLIGPITNRHGVTVARTSVIPNSQDPVWKERFDVPLAHDVCFLEFAVKDNDVFGADVIGTARISASSVRLGHRIHEWLPLFGLNKRLHKPNTALLVDLNFKSVQENPIYEHGIAGDPEKLGVRNTYFPLRKGGMIRLYQDAHVNERDFPKKIHLENGKLFDNGKCWEDICHAIFEAKELIYIIGWSIYHKVRLVREPTSTRLLPEFGDLTLGELLKYKAQQGVRVCLLVWDDKTSHDKFLIKRVGVMDTHDEETHKYFKHSHVNCLLAPRYASNKLSIFKQKVVGTIYSHHQKCVLVDMQTSQNKRKLTAFIGGLDLCNGRYDTPEHRLFGHLDTVFFNDFRNPTFPNRLGCVPEVARVVSEEKKYEERIDQSIKFWRAFQPVFQTSGKYSGIFREYFLVTKYMLMRLCGHVNRIAALKSLLTTKEEIKCPRQPWHDLHCKIDGPAAYDVLTNFEQRWSKATNWWEFSGWYRKPFIESFLHNDDQVSREEDGENWHVQVFRSIDSGSVNFTRKFKETREKSLVCEKNLVVDKSIHTAYVQAIRSAKHFIYIENQYFIGSCYGWPTYESSDAGNLIPMEIALKIVSKIRARERFAVYIIIPMWPEGNPCTSALQEILLWQSQTIQMMYTIVARELLNSVDLNDSHVANTLFRNLGKVPQDYLNFYCLGNREMMPHSTIQVSDAKTVPSLKFRRFMIYVHSKGMIVDDEYIILGSANINQRSLDGSRDTEIAMGAYQPHHTWTENNGHPNGQICGYRMSLWQEHLGMENDLFKKPYSLECVKKVNNVADENWKRFIADEPYKKMQGHLLKYPISVGVDGIVEALTQTFPDVGGKIIGGKCKLPDVLTM